MAKLLKLRRGTTSQHSSFTGAEGECTVDTTKDTLVVHDGSTAGGRPLLRQDLNNIGTGVVTSAMIENTTIVDGDINGSAAIAQSKLDIANATTSAAGYQSAADKTKLDGIETAATADQTAAEIRTLVESASDSNVFTDADHSKLNAIEASATADQTNAEIRAAVEAASDSNVFTDDDHSKLNGIAASANNYSHPNHSGDVTSSGDGATTIADDAVTYAKIQNVTATDRVLGRDSSGAGIIEEISPSSLRTMLNVADGANAYTHPNHSGEVTSTADGATVIADNIVDEANLKVSNSPTNGYVLTAQSGNTGGMTWEATTAGATGGNSNANAVFWENEQTVTHDYTIQNNYNAGSFGPITINSGITVTVGAGESWTVI